MIGGNTSRQEDAKEETRSPVTELKGCIVINVFTKPGAKQTAVTDITTDAVGIQIAAPAREGEANAALVAFLAKILSVRKGDVRLEKGSKSRIKTVTISSDAHLQVETIVSLLQAEIQQTN